MELRVEKMVYGGEGLARLPQEDPASQLDDGRRGKAVFLPFVLEGERVEAELTEERPGFARAEMRAVLEASAHRIEPPCPYFSRCGGCQYQHSEYANQVAIKSQILRETLRRLAKLEWQQEIRAHPSPPWNYRNRARLRVRGGREFSLGYNRVRSHELLPVEQCPISSPLINQGIAHLWAAGRSGLVPPSVREVELFADAENQRLQVSLLIESRPQSFSRSRFSALGKTLCDALPQGSSVHVLPGTGAPRALVSWGEREFRYRAGEHDYRVSPGSFFQTNRFLVEALLGMVGRERGAQALDLYAGVGLFAVPLAHAFERVTAVEASASAFRDLTVNVPENVGSVRDATENFLAQVQGPPPDLVVADPPRAGLGSKVVKALTRLAGPRVIYVSCDPATLSRDLRGLIESGYRVERIDLLDLFPQTFHIESVVFLAR